MIDSDDDDDYKDHIKHGMIIIIIITYYSDRNEYATLIMTNNGKLDE
jgi:hypothetical protein